MPKIIINRSSEYSNAFRNISILANGKEVAKMKNGESAQFKIPAGSYTLKANIDWCYSNEITINAAENDVLRFNISGRNPFLALYYITFGRKKYIKLEKID